LQLIHNGSPETYVWIAETFQLPNMASSARGIEPRNALPRPIGSS
jgi:hypothetical protein